ncbi:MATE efflux family protein 1 [Capsicum baccatum]|uniref:MATE efflux family protein 1 n=1 Tax=Capsicum baccatum TaxID=33114 RepID=A0A2G2VN96_CAPBA|nr:MATE efflux family protein 1 [Capsicum baccatum]
MTQESQISSTSGRGIRRGVPPQRHDHEDNSGGYTRTFKRTRSVEIEIYQAEDDFTILNLEMPTRIVISTDAKVTKRSVFKVDELGLEIARIALPAALALTAGPVELAAVGVSIAVFNQASRIAIFPLVSVTTSFVAEEDTVAKVSPEPRDTESQDLQSQDAEGLDTESQSNSENKELIPQNGSQYKSETIATTFEVVKPKREKRHLPSASSALIIGAILGLIQAAFLISGANPILNFMGIKSGSPMLKPVQEYLKLRSLGAPAVLFSLAMQGVF